MEMDGSLRCVRQRIVEEDTDDLRHPVGVGHGPRPARRVDLDRSGAARRPAGTRLRPGGRPAQVDPSALSSITSASSFERSSRSAVSFSAARSARASSHELRPHGRLGLVLVEQLDEAPKREDRRPQLVRGVCDELLPGAVETREASLHLVEGGGELADSSVASSGIGVRSRPRRPSRPPAAAAAAAARRRPPPRSRSAKRRRARSPRRSGSGAGSGPPCRHVAEGRR